LGGVDVELGAIEGGRFWCEVGVEAGPCHFIIFEFLVLWKR
jgi:hypothetical protein